LTYVTKYGKEALSFVDHVPTRDVKCALSLVVSLFWEHHKVSEDDSFVEDLLMKLIKSSSQDETNHSNSIGKVNATFAQFVVDFLSMLLLFDAYNYQLSQCTSGTYSMGWQETIFPRKILAPKKSNCFTQVLPQSE
jgi:hypothetical protein